MIHVPQLPERVRPDVRAHVDDDRAGRRHETVERVVLVRRPDVVQPAEL